MRRTGDVASDVATARPLPWSPTTRPDSHRMHRDGLELVAAAPPESRPGSFCARPASIPCSPRLVPSSPRTGRRASARRFRPPASPDARVATSRPRRRSRPAVETGQTLTSRSVGRPPTSNVHPVNAAAARQREDRGTGRHNVHAACICHGSGPATQSFHRVRFTVRDGKGGKDRVTALPVLVRAPLRAHLDEVSG
jgi:hypothetical protein